MREVDHDQTLSLYRRVSCFAHTLQLVVHQFDHLTTSKWLLRCTQSLVNKVKKSTKPLNGDVSGSLWKEAPS